MRTLANSKRFDFKAVKTNKTSVNFWGNVEGSSFLTPSVKVEVFQNFSNAVDLGGYFCIRKNDKWCKEGRITGLKKTSLPDYFYGDRKVLNSRTLLIFRLNTEWSNLRVWEFPNGNYPQNLVEDIIQRL